MSSESSQAESFMKLSLKMPARASEVLQPLHRACRACRAAAADGFAPGLQKRLVARFRAARDAGQAPAGVVGSKRFSVEVSKRQAR